MIAALCAGLVEPVTASDVPDTSQFMGMLTTCAAGANVKFNADLVGSIEGIYAGQKTKGFADLKSETQFLQLLPEAQKLEGYRLYTECIKAIVNDPKASKARNQTTFLAEYRSDTPMEKVKEVFGVPAKIKKLYRGNARLLDQEGHPASLYWFDGVNIDFFVASTDDGHVLGAGVYAPDNPKDGRIPYLTMGLDDRTFNTLQDFRLNDFATFGDGNMAGVHVRFHYYLTPIIYFGAPGGYMNYEFIFQPKADSYKTCNFSEEDLAVKNMCKVLKPTHPVMAFVYFTEGILDEGTSDTIMEWIYNFAQ